MQNTSTGRINAKKFRAESLKELSKEFAGDLFGRMNDDKTPNAVWGIRLNNHQIQKRINGEKPIDPNSLKPIVAAIRELSSKPRRSLSEHIDAIADMEVNYACGMQIDNSGNPLSDEDAKQAAKNLEMNSDKEYGEITANHTHDKRDGMQLMMEAFKAWAKANPTD